MCIPKEITAVKEKIENITYAEFEEKLVAFSSTNWKYSKAFFATFKYLIQLPTTKAEFLKQSGKNIVLFSAEFTSETVEKLKEMTQNKGDHKEVEQIISAIGKIDSDAKYFLKFIFTHPKSEGFQFDLTNQTHKCGPMILAIDMQNNDGTYLSIASQGSKTNQKMMMFDYIGDKNEKCSFQYCPELLAKAKNLRLGSMAGVVVTNHLNHKNKQQTYNMFFNLPLLQGK